MARPPTRTGCRQFGEPETEAPLANAPPVDSRRQPAEECPIVIDRFDVHAVKIRLGNRVFGPRHPFAAVRK